MNPSALMLRDRDNKPQNLSAVLALGDQARVENDAGKAFAFYAQATELDPNSARAWIGRAGTTPNLDDAIKSWACALSLSPADAEAKSALAQRIEEKVLQSKVEDVGNLLNLGRTLGAAGQKELAHRLLRQATELDDTNEEAWIWRAGVANDSKEVVSCLNHALALNPSNAQAKAGLQWAMSLQANRHSVIDGNGVDQIARLVEQAQQLLQKQDRAGAHELFQKATELDRLNEAAWLWRGSTTTDVDEAVTCMDQALAINPRNESAREARSWLRAKRVREGGKANLQGDMSIQSRTHHSVSLKQSSATSLFLLITPILIILLGLAIVIWKLIL